MTSPIQEHPFEPFRIKTIEKIHVTSRAEREEHLKKAKFNLFNLPSNAVAVDLLTDSGTGALSDQQWASLVQGDESYAGSSSYAKLEEAVKRIFRFNHFLPTHQGRAAEAILMSCMLQRDGQQIIPSNTHFDTTAGHILSRGAIPQNFTSIESEDPKLIHPFKGNVNIEKLREFLTTNHERVPFCMVVVTNNGGGGQPVSMKNIQEYSALCREFKKPFFIDACRYAENSFFIKQREPEYSSWSVEEIAKKMFSLADGATFSGKKDALVNIGGLLMMNDENLYQNAKAELIMYEGFPSYGGMAGRDVLTMATGLIEGIDEKYLEYRVSQVGWLHAQLVDRGIPVISPPGGHAIYIDAGAMLPHIPPTSYPAQSLSIELYREGGVRTVELGSVMFEYVNTETGETVTPKFELVRMALPRRMYTESHLKSVIKTVENVAKYADDIRGVVITKQPKFLRHFSAEFETLLS